MLSSDAKQQIINKLAEFDIVCHHFTNVDSVGDCFPNYIISATIHGMSISLKLLSCILGQNVNAIGIEVSPSSFNKDKIVSFTVSLHPNDLSIVHEHIKHKYVHEQLTIVDEINRDFPFKIDYKVSMIYESFLLVTGTYNYTDSKYEIRTIAEQPSFSAGVFIENQSGKFTSKGQLLLRIRQTGYYSTVFYSTYKMETEKNRDIQDVKLRIFQELLFYYMKNTNFKFSELTRDELIVLSYEHLLSYITVQKMVDI